MITAIANAQYVKGFNTDLPSQASLMLDVLNCVLEVQVPARPSNIAGAPDKNKASKGSGGGIIAAIDAVAAGQS